MNGLQAEFSDRIDFVHLNIDYPQTLPYRELYDMVRRSQYALVDAQGTVVQRWFGPLEDQQADVRAYLTQFLGS